MGAGLALRNRLIGRRDAPGSLSAPRRLDVARWLRVFRPSLSPDRLDARRVARGTSLFGGERRTAHPYRDAVARDVRLAAAAHLRCRCRAPARAAVDAQRT